MCILCDRDSLRLLVSPLSQLPFPELAEAIRVAREAAAQLVLDTADALTEFDSPDAALDAVGPDTYVRYAVERAEADGLVGAREAREWMEAAERGELLIDPRVQAFLSSATEGLASYLERIEEMGATLARFLEVSPEAIPFEGIGPHGEICFAYGEETCVLLSEEEAMQIAVDGVADTLWEEDPTLLLRYSSLPEDAVDILTAAQRRPREEANDVLAGIVDVAALATDAVRQSGYARFVAAGVTDDFSEQRFGEVVVVRLRPFDVAGEGS